MRYKHESMLPLGAFKQRGSVGNRSMRLHGGDGYVPDFEESRRMEAEQAAYLASQGYPQAQQNLNQQIAFESQQAQSVANAVAQEAAQAQAWASQVTNESAQAAAQQSANELARLAQAAQIQANYVASPQNYAPTSAPQAATIDTAGLTAGTADWKGTPTVYTDANGNVKGVRTSFGIVPVESLNPLVPKGGKITADTLVQAMNSEGQKLYLSDMNDPNSITTRNTGIPAIGGTVAQQAFVPARDNSLFGTIGGDLAAAAKDPSFWKFLAAAAAITGGGLALNSAFGAGGLGAAGGATAFPVADLGLLGATELGAAGAGGMSAAEALALAAEGGLGAEFGVQGALGGLGGAGAGGMSAAEALALASEGGLGAEFGVQGALGSSGGGLGALFGGLGSSSLLQGGLALGGLAALNALAPKQGSTGGSTAPTGLTSEQLKAIVATMPSAMGNYMNMAGNPFGYGGGTIDSANVNLANLFPGFSLPTAGPYFGAGRFGDYYAPQAASTTPISPTGLV